jgi:hypothetical protein
MGRPFAETLQNMSTAFEAASNPTSTLSRLFRRVRARKQLILADLF